MSRNENLVLHNRHCGYWRNRNTCTCFATMPGQTAKGIKMPQTSEEFQYMGDLYEKGMIERDQEISRLKQRINKLEQKIAQLKTPVPPIIEGEK